MAAGRTEKEEQHEFNIACGSHRSGPHGRAAVVDIDRERAEAAIAGIEGAVALTDAVAALDNGDVNALLIATPGFQHHEILLKALERNIPILCEKPLTPDAASSWEIVQAETRRGYKRIQVGFMRRYDAEYAQLRGLISSGYPGRLHQ